MFLMRLCSCMILSSLSTCAYYTSLLTEQPHGLCCAPNRNINLGKITL